jgi:hypothetical protein
VWHHITKDGHAIGLQHINDRVIKGNEISYNYTGIVFGQRHMLVPTEMWFCIILYKIIKDLVCAKVEKGLIVQLAIFGL